MLTIHQFEVGFCTHPGCVALKGASFKACKFPARAWLIEDEKQRWLFDTGYANHFYDHTRTGIMRLYRSITPVHFESKDALINQLASRGIKPIDINGIILSHFHGDHIAGLRDFPGCSIICSGDGWVKTRNLTGFSALKNAFVSGLIPDDFDQRTRFYEGFEQANLPEELQSLGQGYAVNSQKTLLIVPLPGHAAGHIGLCVLTENGWVLLAGDAAWSPTNYRELRGPMAIANIIMDDKQAYYQTLNKLHDIDKQNITIYLCHEGELI